MKPDEETFFEGTEKKVELIVDPRGGSLRERGHEFWDRVTRRAGARILSRISGPACEAYLLSESSLFVFDHKMIMITCGRTRLVEAVLELLGSVRTEDVRFFVYERKNEVFPHRQPTSFFDDVRVLREQLPGPAFRFGDQDEHHICLHHLDREFEGSSGDRTLEILMHGIHDEVRSVFQVDDAPTIRRKIGLGSVFHGFDIDDHRFEPGGYSLNAIRDEEYWTLHVTPQSTGSYVSFETNHRDRGGYAGVLDRVVDLFRPRAFDVVLFDDGEPFGHDPEGYVLKTHVARAMGCGYHIRFLGYYRPQREVRAPTELPIDGSKGGE